MKNIYFTFRNEWLQIGKKFNWYNFTAIELYFENEPYTGGVELTFMLLGLGFTLRYNYDFEGSPTGRGVERWTNEQIETKLKEARVKIEDILK